MKLILIITKCTHLLLKKEIWQILDKIFVSSHLLILTNLLLYCTVSFTIPQLLQLFCCSYSAAVWGHLLMTKVMGHFQHWSNSICMKWELSCCNFPHLWHYLPYQYVIFLCVKKWSKKTYMRIFLIIKGFNAYTILNTTRNVSTHSINVAVNDFLLNYYLLILLISSWPFTLSEAFIHRTRKRWWTWGYVLTLFCSYLHLFP